MEDAQLFYVNQWEWFDSHALESQSVAWWRMRHLVLSTNGREWLLLEQYKFGVLGNDNKAIDG